MRIAKYGPEPTDEIERFWCKVIKGPGCWIWTGTTSRGYGNFRVGSLADGTRRKVLAHRYSYELVHGRVEEMLLHSCDVPRCVNPAHLRPGTAKENAADAIERGRIYRPDHHGQRNPNYRHGRFVKAA
jgi:hypothetical protein